MIEAAVIRVLFGDRNFPQDVDIQILLWRHEQEDETKEKESSNDDEKNLKFSTACCKLITFALIGMIPRPNKNCFISPWDKNKDYDAWWPLAS